MKRSIKAFTIYKAGAMATPVDIVYLEGTNYDVLGKAVFYESLGYTVSGIDLHACTDQQLDEIYYLTIGYRPIAEEGVTRDEVVQILTEYALECEPLVLPNKGLTV